MGQYKHHVFVCSQGKTCARDGGDEVFSTMKRAVKQAGLNGIVRVNKAGCMNQCGHGPMVVVYPDDIWYSDVDAKAAQKIVDRHLVHGEVVRASLYHAPPGDNKKSSR